MNSMKKKKDRTLKDELTKSVLAQYVTRDQWRREWQSTLAFLSAKSHGQRFVTLYRRQGSRSPRKRNAKKAKWLSEEALQIAEKRRETKSKGEK